MRKLAVVSGVALMLAGAWTAVSAQDGFAAQPAANAYMSFDFGHPNPKAAAFSPLHYGLKMQYDSRMPAFDAASRPPLAQLDFDARGNRVGSVGGVPFMARIRPAKQNDDDSAADSTSPAEGIEFFDLALLGVGVAGLGYLIYEVARNDESPDPLANGGGDGGGGGGATGGSTGGLLGGLLGGGFAGNRGFINVERDLEYQRWLDGGTGHMGDLTP